MPDKKPILVLFDGHALIHRAFHALPPLSVRKTGEQTGAVYGFANMVLKILAELKPTHYAVAFDHPAPTFRHKEFAGYKAHRPPAPDELISQFKRVRQLVDAFNIPGYEVEGYEADDILGTLAKQAAAKGLDTVIVTGDMDTLQLVSPNTRVLLPRPGKSFSDTILYDEGKVEERYGIAPRQIADYKGLKGDPSDDIPGVNGIGEKTAVKLLQQFGSVEGILEHIDEVAPAKAQNALKDNDEAARQSKRLATIVTEAPVELDLDRCAIRAIDRDRTVALFRELEFNRLLTRLEDIDAADRTATARPQVTEPVTTEYVTVDTPQKLRELIDSLSKADSFAFDTETTGFNPRYASLVGLSFSIEAGKAYYVPVGHRMGDQLPASDVLEGLRPVISDKRIAKIAQNAKFDMAVLAEQGVEVGGLYFDSMIAACLLGEKSLGLKSLAFNRLGVEMTPITSLIGTGAKQISMDYVPIADAAPYACADADMTLRLSTIFEKELKDEGLWQLFDEVEMPLVTVLLDMERTGVKLDADFLREMAFSLSERAARLEGKIHDLVGHRFNINSSQQLGAVLFNELRLEGGKKIKSGYSTDAATLEKLKGTHPVIEPLIEYRQVTKIKTTYADSLPSLVNPKTGRVHTSFNQTGTTTGRLSSSDPNLQNIPARGELGRQVRRAFVADKGCILLSADYSQIDLRVAAHLSQDPQLIAAFERGEDIHSSTAAHILGIPPGEVTPDQRRLAKVVNFGVLYGMSGYGLEQATELTREQAEQFIKTYYEKYRGIREYLETTKKQARERGYVETALGRRRYIPDINASNAQVRTSAERMAINMPIQGTSADIIKLAMIRIHAEMKKRALKSRMILQVHDDLVFEVPEAEIDIIKKMVSEIMPDAMKLSVPLTVDIKTGTNWGEMS